SAHRVSCLFMRRRHPTATLFPYTTLFRSEFKRRYRAELLEGGSIDKRNRTIKNHGQKFTLCLLQELARRGPVTLVCHCPENQLQDRKSTRLNSSHRTISYAVFCLKKKNYS